MFDVVIQPHGDLVDLHSWDDFSEALTGIVELVNQKVIIDMSRVSRMSSNYIGSLISCSKAAQEKNIEFVLINVNTRLYDLLAMLRLTEFMTIDTA